MKDEARLNTLLESWESTRNPEVGDAIVRLGRSLPRPPLSAENKASLERAWHALAAARDPADVDRLIRAPWPAKWADAKERVEALARFAPDPRIWRGLVEMAPRYSTNPSYFLHHRITLLLNTCPDPATVDGLSRLLPERFGRGNTAWQTYGSARKRARAVEPEPASDRVVALAEGVPRDPDLSVLWESVYADPSDLGTRMVLADALQMVDDPRGELIALQCGPQTGATRKRAKALLKEHIDTWMGALPSVERASRVFERGFLTRARTTVSSRDLVKLADLREWRTLEHLNAGAALAGQLFFPRLPVLRTFSGGLQDIGEGPYPSLLAVGPVYDLAGLPLAAVPNLRFVLASSTNRRAYPEGEAARVLRRFEPTGVSVVALKHAYREELAILLKELRSAQTRLTVRVDLSENKKDELHGPGWQLWVRGTRTSLTFRGGGRWSVNDAVVLLEAVAQAGLEEPTLQLPAKGKAGERAAELLGRVPGLRHDPQPVDPFDGVL